MANGPFRTYLRLKEAGLLGPTDSKMYAFPIQYTDEDGHLTDGYIQDAIEDSWINEDEPDNQENHYSLTVIILNQDNSRIHFLEKQCYVLGRCVVNWDDVHCINEIALQQ